MTFLIGAGPTARLQASPSPVVKDEQPLAGNQGAAEIAPAAPGPAGSFPSAAGLVLRAERVGSRAGTRRNHLVTAQATEESRALGDGALVRTWRGSGWKSGQDPCRWRGTFARVRSSLQVEEQPSQSGNKLSPPHTFQFTCV